MLVGVMSDSHDNMSKLAKAVKIFNESNLQYVLHAGDYTTGLTLSVLKGLKAEFIGIFGNNDGGIMAPEGGALSSQHRIYKQPHEFTLDNKKFIMIHEHHLVAAIAQSARYDVLIYGHTHKPEATVRTGTFVLNPGELCGWLHGSATVAILDTQSMKARIIGVD